ncbi:TPA: type IV secretion system protein [Yersinia enterocolitica]|uniref:type IV secretion system protein n=1 Tax=Yersinia massiliensis TaxID=419257 RepID=UPI001562B13B|nr:type IV secretion system protein [Yersinia massiliensis]QKJ09281.1 type IV secretion system protein [Yersinia massiliensis]HDX9051771.1 type IV secretion system protein [Yersinia enterocolitica]
MLKKRLPLLLALTLWGANAPVFASGILVFDATQQLENAQQWAKELSQWKETAQHYTSQIDAYKAQLATATGLRDIGSFVNQAKGLTSDLKNLQKNGLSLNSVLNSGGMSGELESIYSKYSMFDTCHDSGSASYVETCKQTVVNKAVALEDSEVVQQKISSTLDDVSNLSYRIENAKDAKEAQDLANTLSLKTVQLNALTTQWEMNVKQAEMRDSMLKDKQLKAFRKQQSEASIPTFN